MSAKEFSEVFISYNLNLFSEEIESNTMFVRQAMKNYYLDYFQDLANTFYKIDLENFNTINELLYNAFKKEKHVFTIGNGGSGATASHLVCDLNKDVNSGQSEKFKALCLVDNLPSLLAYANDISYSAVFCEQLKNFMGDNDVVIAFSGSGNSENIIRAVRYANENGGITIGFSGFDGGQLSKTAQYCLVVPVNDMQKCEDIHMILCHLIMQTMENLLKMSTDG